MNKALRLIHPSSLIPHPFLSSRVGRDGRRVAVEVAVEPVELPVETFYQVLRLACACEVVVLAGEDDELGRHAEMLERARTTKIGRDTSELQSRRDLVCRLLLEKKKKKQYTITEIATNIRDYG